ncbi:MAG TPA: glutaredoxin family protein [Thermodesulfovibrionales bacterium]|jgi:glutaredoxin|nr:glutaredoxin family protein [Thermodesulfovibrionales bacterium]
MKRVTLFTLSTCPVCKRVKTFLDDHGIPYSQIEVDTLDSGEQWLMTKELMKHNPQGTYPTVVIEEVIRGYDLEALKAKLLDGSRE